MKGETGGKREESVKDGRDSESVKREGRVTKWKKEGTLRKIAGKEKGK